MNDSSGTADRSRSVMRRLLILLALIAVVAVGTLIFLGSSRDPDELIAAIQVSLRNQQFAQARMLAEELLEQQPDSAQALFLAATAARESKDFQAALDYLERVPEDSPDYTNSIVERGNVRIEAGRPALAEALFHEALERDPENESALANLGFLLRVQARNWDLVPYALKLIKLGKPNRDLLFPLAGPDRVWLDEGEFGFVDHCMRETSNDFRVALARIRMVMMSGGEEQARPVLEEIVGKHPDHLEAQVVYGTLLMETGTAQEIVQWFASLPANAGTHPDIWFLRGTWAERQGMPDASVRCFWEAARVDPNHRRSLYRLAQKAGDIGRPELAKAARERFELLEELHRMMRYGDGSAVFMQPDSMCRVAELMIDLGRLWEAQAWATEAGKLPKGKECAETLLERVTGRLESDTPAVLAEARVADHFDLSDLSLPDWKSLAASVGTDSDVDLPSVQFQDVAKPVGLEFEFVTGASGKARMFEFSGGGCGVIDFDSDGWPDLYLTQGGSWPVDPQDPQRPLDRLFRNIRGERFADVTRQAGVRDGLYGQGVTAADFDGDGFPDLYVTNIGANRLFHNNGDGTFTDVTDGSGTAGDAWSIGSVFADLNQDQLPDLYCVNYLGGDDVFDRTCEVDGLPAQCPVNYFPAVQDRLYVNNGDGTFGDVTDASGIVVPDGKGMGVIAADFDHSGRLGLYVTNDTTPNFLFHNLTEMPGAAPKLEEIGARAGVALSGWGDSQSSMGIAAGDANQDGLIDLLVTNFIVEPNNLYLQRSPLLFEDQTGQESLRESSARVMGWGAQFLDSDLDGQLDLIVANGHLDKNTSGDAPFLMDTQYLHNLGAAEFLEVPGRRLGGYFRTKHAARAVARLDWNRDGLDDVCLTHLQEPVALLENRTPEAGTFLKLTLRAVNSDRDATGTRVTLTLGDTARYGQLVAGDGFQASNERVLTFGLGGQERVDSLVIHWPSGLEQTVSDVEGRTHWLVVEGRPALRLEANK